jgi:hypothetical protein
MASKNLGAVIQRAISDGAFRRQLQSDPAAALRGFNLTSDEIAAIRSGDSSKLMSLGVDQRMSKAFSVGGAMADGAARSTVSDLAAGGTASTIANDPTAGTREGIVGDPTSGSRDAVNIGAADGSRSALDAGATSGTSDALTTGQVSGTRAIHDSAPFDSRSAVSTGDFAGNTRAVNDSEPFDSRAAMNDNIAAASAGRGGSLAGDNASGIRSVNDSEPFDSRGAVSTGGDVSGTRAVNDSEPFAGNAVINDNVAAASAGRGGSLAGDMTGSGSAAVQDPYSGQYQGVSPDFQSGTVSGHIGDASSVRAVNDVAPFGTTGTSAVEDASSPEFSVASRMVDAGTADSIRAINDVAPFDSGLNTTATGGEFLTGDARLDPGTDSSQAFVPSDSADVQREMLDGGDHGNALGNTGTGHPS